MKHLIIYYSYTNHTRELVKRLQNKFSYDVFEIEPVIPYSNNYQQVVDEAERDVPRGVQPEIKPFTLDLEQYDVIILATPVWWYTFASPVNTFLHQYRLQGKIIIPLVTNGGWVGHTIEDIERLSGGTIQNPISVKFDGDRLVDEALFEKWMERVGESK